jgi:DNA-binding LacI/PurR family transcriptional regulator
VRAPTESVGRLAAEQLFSVLAKGAASEVTLLPTELIIRRSCGCDVGMSIPDDKKEVIHT